MNVVTTIAYTLLRITGVVQIVLGLLFWTGNALNPISVHVLFGLILVLALLVLAMAATVAGVNRGFVAVAIAWSFIVPILGVTQVQLLPGRAHWLIEVLHLLVGLAAIGMGNRLARAPHPRATPAASPGFLTGSGHLQGGNYDHLENTLVLCSDAGAEACSQSVLTIRRHKSRSATR